MTSDPTGWFLASQALDHHATVQALDSAVQGQLGEALADDLAAGLARAGYALVRLDQRAEVTQDLTAQVDAFLARKED
jgi:hypothetical protein